MRVPNQLDEGIIQSLYLYLFPKGRTVKTVRDKVAKVVSDIFRFNNEEYVVVEYQDGGQDRVAISSLELV